jgi:hypothetical protein
VRSGWPLLIFITVYTPWEPFVKNNFGMDLRIAVGGGELRSQGVNFALESELGKRYDIAKYNTEGETS